MNSNRGPTSPQDPLSATLSDEQRELAGVRGASAQPLRELTFVTDDQTIEVDITRGPRTTHLSGTVEPPAAGSVEVVIGGEVFEGIIDTAGGFEIRDLPSGTVLAMVSTAEGKTRLGSFEI